MSSKDYVKKAIKQQLIVDFYFNAEPERMIWGTITCMDDDETGFYYKPKGMGLTRSFAPLNQVTISQQLNYRRLL